MNATMNGIKDTMKDVYQSNTASQAVFKALMQRERFRRRSDLHRMYQSINANINYEEFLDVFKHL